MQRSVRPGRRRLGPIIAAIALAGVLPLLFATPGQTQVPYASALIKASATGTLVHAGALQSGSTRLLDGEVGFSGAAYNSQGLTTTLSNEMQRQYAAVNASKLSSARASALEVGLGVTPKDPNQVIVAGEADASSPPAGHPDTKSAGPIPAGPLAWANLLTGTADANAVPSVCALGTDLSNGTATAADVQLLDTGTSNPTGLQSPVLAADAPAPDRAVGTSTSRTLFVSQRDASGKLQGSDFGAMSEVRQTIAPVTFFKGTPNEFTIEVLGEWVLQTVATGLPGGSYVHYGPEKATPSTPVLRVVQPTGTQTFSFQDVFGSTGLVITVPNVAEIVIGEDPRKIGGDDKSKPATSPSTGTDTSAAVDVVRVRSLAGAPSDIADVRLGHMEASASVPSGGVACPVPISKTPDVSNVGVGGTFTTTFAVNNPFKCTLKDLTISDDVSTDGAATYTVDSTDPSASVTGGGTKGTITFPAVDLKPGASKTVSAAFGAHGGAGNIIDTAHATATLKDCGAPGAKVAGVDVSVVGAGVSGASPVVTVPVGSGGSTSVGAAVATPVANAAVAPNNASNGSLPRSGADIRRFVALGLLLIAVGCFGIGVRRAARHS